MTFHIWVPIITEMISIIGTTIATLIMRWLLRLSTIEQDIQWIKSTKLWKTYARLKFYRGSEYLYQVRARRVYSSSNH